MRVIQVKRDEKNNRNDLHVLANSYSGRLRAKKCKLLQEKDFHQVRKPEEKKPPPPVTNGVDKNKVSHWASHVLLMRVKWVTGPLMFY